MKRAALINDLSGIGRCSLTVALPIISACGHECAVLPTAVLSNHTGFDSYTFFDFTEHMKGYIDCWEKLGLSFDMIYSGFLGSAFQADIAIDFFSRFGQSAVKLVDPVLGDGGLLYDTCGDIICQMKKLACLADIITPNLTELSALNGTPYPKNGITLAEIEQMCRKIGVDNIVVTGLEHETVPEIGAGHISNLIYKRGNTDITDNEKFPISYCGTGDVFASVLCGLVMKDKEFSASVRAAADFVELCVRDTYNNQGKKLYGIQFEDKLNLL